MANLLKLTVIRIDESQDTYPVLAKTKVAFERHFSMGLGAALDQKREECILWLAWDAEHTAGKVVKVFDEWLNDVADVTVERELPPLGAAPASPAGLPASP